MMQLKSRVPDYLPELTGMLIKAGAGQSAITRFHQYWNALPPERSDAPCPFCLGNDVDAPLVGLDAGEGIDHLRCPACKHIFELRHPAPAEAAGPDRS